MSIDEIFRAAKRTIMKEGRLHSLLFVETRDQLGIQPVDSLMREESTDGRAIGFFVVGRRMRREESESAENVLFLAMVTETWFRIPPPGEKRDLLTTRPSTQPDRREGVMAITMKVESGRPTTYEQHMMEIVRNGGVIDLAPIPELAGEQVEMASPFFPAFLDGLRGGEIPRTHKETEQLLVSWYRAGGSPVREE